MNSSLITRDIIMKARRAYAGCDTIDESDPLPTEWMRLALEAIAPDLIRAAFLIGLPESIQKARNIENGLWRRAIAQGISDAQRLTDFTGLVDGDYVWRYIRLRYNEMAKEATA